MAYITKKKIATAFLGLVATRGFDHTSVKAVMDATDLGRQTFYLHFQDKYELLDWVIDDRMQEIIEANFDYLQWPEIIRLLCFELEAQTAFYRSAATTQFEIDVTAMIAQHLSLLLQRTSHLRGGRLAQQPELTATVAQGVASALIANVCTLHPRDYEILAAHATQAIADLLVR